MPETVPKLWIEWSPQGEAANDLDRFMSEILMYKFLYLLQNLHNLLLHTWLSHTQGVVCSFVTENARQRGYRSTDLRGGPLLTLLGAFFPTGPSDTGTPVGINPGYLKQEFSCSHTWFFLLHHTLFHKRLWTRWSQLAGKVVRTDFCDIWLIKMVSNCS